MLVEEPTDLDLLANELGVNISEVRLRREQALQAELDQLRQRREAEQAAKKKAYEDEIIKIFYENYGEHLFLSINGDRLESIDDSILQCSCGSSSAALRHLLFEAVNAYQAILKYGFSRSDMPIYRTSQTCLKCGKQYNYMIQLLI